MSLITRKILFVGDAESGKSSYLRSVLSKPLDPNYHPTLGVEVRRVRSHLTPTQTIELDVWDCAGVEEYRGLFEDHYSDARGVVYFIDNNLSDIQKSESLNKWKAEVNKVHSNLPYVVVYTKFDLHPTGFALGSGSQNALYYQISTKNGTNIQLPLKSIIHKIIPNN